MFIDFRKQKGFSLIEILVTLIIVSILIGVINRYFPVMNKLVNRYADQSLFKENQLVFLAVISKDFYESELVEVASNNTILFNLDLDFDGDYKDAAESIGYRWNRNKNRIDRKSGKGNFQKILGGVSRLTWEIERAETVVCLKIQIESILTKKSDILEFCRSPFLN